MRHVKDGWTTWGIRLRCPKLDPHCVYMLCIVMYCYVLYICYTMVYIYIIVSILCYNTCYNICIHICYRCLINIMIIYIYWLSDRLTLCYEHSQHFRHPPAASAFGAPGRLLGFLGQKSLGAQEHGVLNVPRFERDRWTRDRLRDRCCPWCHIATIQKRW
jgi:hypothetical protein